MPGEISNADGSVDRFAVLRAVEGHVPSFALLRASQFLRGGTQAFIQERDTDGTRAEKKHEVSAAVWQESTLSSATFCLIEQNVRFGGRRECDETYRRVHLAR